MTPNGSLRATTSGQDTDGLLAREALRISESRYRRLFETARDGILLINAMTGQIEDVNPYLIDILGYTHAEFLGKKLWEVGAFANTTQSQEMFAELQTKGYVRYEDLPLLSKNGKKIDVEFVSNTYDCEGIKVIQCNIREITQRKAAEAEIKKLAFYDPLTLLPNRRLLFERLQHSLVSLARTGHQGALLFIDLDNFKTLNDTLGHDFGDQLLQQVAPRLTSCVREGDTVARLGGDEFVVMLENLNAHTVDAATQVKMVGEKILSSLNQPYTLAFLEYKISASIGATLFSRENKRVDEILKQADIAMYHAKSEGRNTLRFFNTKLQHAVKFHAALEIELREGLENRQFELYYQAQVDQKGRLTGAEALVRWRHPRRGLISPADFIPLAEETGLILSLGDFVLLAASSQLAAWGSRPTLKHLTVAVNVSARQFHQANFVKHLGALLKRTGANPRLLKLELTESVLLENVLDVSAKMEELGAEGISISLDDFGTGYSSLSYLKRLPLGQLKIDQSFVHDILTNANDATIAATIISLGRSFGLTVIAEGVETIGQRDFLAGQGCHAFQGYLFGKPVPAETFERLSVDVGS
jgi:diguanylate cyclase (GGDEF)-like protein/PAS domain S-box-containing protein